MNFSALRNKYESLQVYEKVKKKTVGFREAGNDEPRLLNLYMRGKGDRYNSFIYSLIYV